MKPQASSHRTVKFTNYGRALWNGDARHSVTAGSMPMESPLRSRTDDRCDPGNPSTTGVRIVSERSTLLVLTSATFAVAFGAFAVIGLLPPMAGDLGASDAAAGQALAVYALVYAVGSPLCVALTGSLSRRTVLVGGMSLFAAGGLAAAMAPDLATVIVARIPMALGAGMVTPVAATVAVHLVPEAERGRALAVVFAGLTVAQAVGLPMGAWLAYAVGWRETFLASSGLAVVAAVVLLLLVPRSLGVPRSDLRTLVAALTDPTNAAAVSFTAFFTAGTFTVFTYMATLVEFRFTSDGATVSLVLFVIGAGSIVAGFASGRAADRFDASTILLALCGAQLAIMPLLTLADMPLPVFCVLCVLWSLVSASFMVPQQARLASLAPAFAPVLLALNASAIYVGTFAGGVAGGATLQGSGAAWLGPAGAGMIVLAEASLLLTRRLVRRRS